MGYNIERRPPHQLEIAKIDTLLRDGHDAMSFSLDPLHKGTWQVENQKVFISIAPHKIAVWSVTSEFTSLEQFWSGKDLNKSFFETKAEVYEPGKQTQYYSGRVGIKKDLHCNLMNLMQIQTSILRLRQIKDDILPLAFKKDSSCLLKAA